MAKTPMVAKQQKKQKFAVHEYTHCGRCDYPRFVYRKFKLYRIYFRELAYKGQVPDVRKAGW